jgi:hypothetical protein
MDDNVKRPGQVGRLTSDRVTELSEETRAEIARSLAGRPAPVPGAPARPGPHLADEETAALAIRLAADLHRTERRLHQIQRASGGSRYQVGSASAPTGRYARLLSRADRLERQLRALK